jgi:DNA-3-methyladenine glycosylase II
LIDTRFHLAPQGPFNLRDESEFFGGWPPLGADPSALAMAFPVEGWRTSAVVVVRQTSGNVTGEVHGASGPDAEAAWNQALAVLSLDMDGSGFPEVGRRDPVIGRLQERYRFLRPVCFHSPYEAAANFVIGQRSSIRQARATRMAMARELGDAVTVGEEQLYAFPRPSALLGMARFSGLSAEKVERLHVVARAAADGVLDRARLRAMPVDQALSELQGLRGIGPFSAQGTLLRGAGLADAVPDDDVTKQAVQRAYELPTQPDYQRLLEMAEPWRPYRMWTTVLLHLWLRREAGGPSRPGKVSRLHNRP